MKCTVEFGPGKVTVTTVVPSADGSLPDREALVWHIMEALTELVVADIRTAAVQDGQRGDRTASITVVWRHGVSVG